LISQFVFRTLFDSENIFTFKKAKTLFYTKFIFKFDDNSRGKDKNLVNFLLKNSVIDSSSQWALEILIFAQKSISSKEFPKTIHQKEIQCILSIKASKYLIQDFKNFDKNLLFKKL